MAVYVGETVRSVIEQVSEHMKGFKNQIEKPITRQFSDHKVDNMRFVVLQSWCREACAYGQFVEEKWIIRLTTNIPFCAVYNLTSNLYQWCCTIFFHST